MLPLTISYYSFISIFISAPLKVLILEGSDHVGGGLESTNFGGLDIPTGKYWLFKGEGEDVLESVRSVGFELNPSNYDSYVVRSENKADLTAEFDERYEVFSSARKNLTVEIIEQVLQGRRADLPARTALAMSNWVASDAVSHVVEWVEYDFFQGVNARHMSTIAPYLQGLGEEYTVTNINQGLFPDVLPFLNEDNLKLNKVGKEEKCGIWESHSREILLLEGNLCNFPESFDFLEAVFCRAFCLIVSLSFVPSSGFTPARTHAEWRFLLL